MSTGEIRVSTGISGLDEILAGGLVAGRAYLVRGGPGSGKSLLCARFIETGVERGEAVLYITAEQPPDRLKEDALKCGINLEKAPFLDLSPASGISEVRGLYSVFKPSHVEGEPLLNELKAAITRFKPKRLVIDSVTQLQYLIDQPFQFRRILLQLLDDLRGIGCTTMLVSEASEEMPDNVLQFLADGVIEIQWERARVPYRIISVPKHRGSAVLAGGHFMEINEHGIEVFPVPLYMPGSPKSFERGEKIPSGVPELDELLHGGLERGTSTLISGPTGVGKTTIGLQFMKEAAGRGERSLVLAFDEDPEVMLARCDAINIPARKMIERGYLRIEKIDVLLAHFGRAVKLIREEVEQRSLSIIMFDSINGALRALVESKRFRERYHTLIRYLQENAVTVISIAETGRWLGMPEVSGMDVTYVADNVILLRYMQIGAELRKVIGVLKKRMSDFEKTIREVQITRYGVKVGEPLAGTEGILGRGMAETRSG